ncbi:LPXTG cell wall anchor domain-containing protein [Promicromonospora sp. CA-289599]|uniref:LPXTG cell wall anchor domain-containing protein n=1 Tax=Promicromonospora sp. CA-289599 TaxID=3240014 RepID=UPI003D8BC779
MRKMTVLGASALLVAGLMGSPVAAFAAPIAGAPVAATPGGGQETCPKEGKVEVPEGEELTEIEVTAEPGYVIVGYCVKAGADASGAGLQEVVVDPPETKVVIAHESGKAISHYTLVTVKAEPTPEPTPTESSQEPSVVPSGEPSEGSSGTPSEPAVEPTTGTPDDESTVPAGEGEATSAPSEEPGELAATGASTAIGFTLIALALVGGGVTLIVLRRKGVLGS